MSVPSTIIRLFEKALSPDEAQQYEFASKVEQILTTFPPKFISQEFFPFLANWIPKNSPKIVPLLCTKVDKLASVPEAFPALALVIESLLASENRENSRIVKNALLTCKGKSGLDSFSFIKRLASSPYDVVRSFAPRVISLLNTTEEQRQIFSSLAFDPAYKVRFAVCLQIPNLSEELGKQVAISMLKDNSSRIKALLPVVCCKCSFWFSSLAEELSNDHDWSVRASVAKEIVNSQDTVSAAKYACKLIEDSVWHVVLCALNTLTQILNRANKNTGAKKQKKSEREKMRESLQAVFDSLIRIMLYPQPSLKSAVIDAFLAMNQATKLDEAKVTQFINDCFTKQPLETRLHFITSICQTEASPFVKNIHELLLPTITALLRSDQWRLRLGIIQLIFKVSTLNGNDPELNKKFMDICFKGLDDEATPVRTAAAEEIAKFFIQEKSDSLYPETYLELKKSNSFRNRQAALKVLLFIGQSAQKEAKAKIIAEMKLYENDACENVIQLARQYISILQS